MGLEEDIIQLRADIDEVKGFCDLAKRPKVQDLLTVELRKLETKLVALLEQKQQSEKLGASCDTPAFHKPPKVYDVPYKNYAWDQSDNFVKLYMTGLTGVQALPSEGRFEVEFDKKSLKFKVLDVNGKNYVLQIKELAEEIVPEKCHHKVKTDTVVIFLAKKSTGKEWVHVTAAEKAKKEKVDNISSSKKEEEDSDPSKSIMNLMKKMYDDGDDEMKRTIAKAWTEGREKNNAGLGNMNF